MPAAGGAPQQLTAGDSVSADAASGDLIVSLQDKDAIRLKRLPAGGGEPRMIQFRGAPWIRGTKLAASIVGPGGLIGIETASAGKWAYQSGIVDARTGSIKRIPVNFDGETGAPVWTRDGKLVTSGSTLGFSIWRFHRAR
jgi:hypothetical protein